MFINGLKILQNMLKQPESMEENVYYTDRQIGNGEAKVWVFRGNCPKCKTLMGKPKDEKGKVAVRAKEHVCPKCGYSAESKAYEEGLTANIEYTCPECGFKGEQQVPFKRKKIKGADTLRFQCQKCKANIDVTKKMK